MEGFKINESDFRNLNQSIKQLSRMSGKSAKDGLRVGTYSLCRSLSASTKLARKYRSITLPKKAYRARIDGKTHFKVWVYKDGKKKGVSIWSRSLKRAKKRKISRVPRRGVAKKAWWLGYKKLYNGNIGGSGNRAKVPAQTLKTSKTERGGNYGIQIINTLKHCEEALRNKGKQDVNTAMRRANTTVQKTIEREVAKQTKKFNRS